MLLSPVLLGLPNQVLKRRHLCGLHEPSCCEGPLATATLHWWAELSLRRLPCARPVARVQLRLERNAGVGGAFQQGMRTGAHRWRISKWRSLPGAFCRVVWCYKKGSYQCVQLQGESHLRPASLADASRLANGSLHLWSTRVSTSCFELDFYSSESAHKPFKSGFSVPAVP